MASNPPGECCMTGHIHEGIARGTIETTPDFEYYLSTPSSDAPKPTKAILFLTDVLGHKALNAQLLADTFASNNHLVVVPDLFHDDPIPANRPEGFDLNVWKQSHGPEKWLPVIAATIKLIHEKYNITRIGGLGYCFGAKPLVHFMTTSEYFPESIPLYAGFTAHPSFVTDEELRAIKRPLAIAAAEKDTIFTKELREKTEGILRELGEGKSADQEDNGAWQITVFSHVEHGFSVRGDLKDKRIKYAKEEAFRMAVGWLGLWA